jgi:hypothetical protein
MKLPDGTTLMHGARPYDPQKAHEYYLRTRKLKGRRKGQGDSYTIKTRTGGTRTISARELSEQKASAAQRVSEIKQRLTRLNQELRKRMGEARERERDAKKGPTRAEKSEKAREAKKYRDKNQQKLANKRKSGGGSKKSSSSSSKTESVDDLKRVVENVRNNLKAAVEYQRRLSSATKNG